MFQIALYEPEIAPNTGNIIRLCANTGASLHLVGKVGFELDDKRLRRAGLDYHEYANLQSWSNIEELLDHLKPKRLIAFSTKGKERYDKVTYAESDLLLFGPETRGLPASILDHLSDHVVRIPMLPQSRSMNLSNAVSVALYQAWMQHDFPNEQL